MTINWEKNRKIIFYAFPLEEHGTDRPTEGKTLFQINLQTFKNLQRKEEEKNGKQMETEIKNESKINLARTRKIYKSDRTNKDLLACEKRLFSEGMKNHLLTEISGAYGSPWMGN